VLVVKLAWRNIWRNTRRTVISTLALGAGVMAIVSIHSFQEVSYQAMIHAVTAGLVGHAQVHGRGYQESPDMSTVVPDAAAVESELTAALPAAQTERRVVGAGLAGAGDVSTAVMVMGIEPQKPGARALLTIEAGAPLGEAPARQVVIGDALARELGVVPGGEVVLIGQAADGSLANDRFRVAGIADAGSFDANATMVFLHIADAQSFFALGEGVHQVIVRLPTDEEDVSHPVSLLAGALDLSRLEIMAWSDILPELKGAIDAKRRNTRVADLIVFLIVALGILNTMTMSTFERTREFGVMASLGTRRGRILGMVLLEAMFQGAIGFALGVAIAWALVHGLGTVNISGLTGGTDILGARLPDVLRLAIEPGSVVRAGTITVLTMLAGGLLPAIRASRLKPVEATRYV
jgi:ABC-type lipoprotein release transport system permease subunit